MARDNVRKILILGAKGMLGQELARVFFDSDPVLWDKEDLDITNRGEVQKKIGELKPVVIINAAAYTAVDDCEKNRELAMKVNGKAVGYLVEALNNVNVNEARSHSPSIFIHYSTDYVFNGENPNGYKEDDAPRNPLNAYGESKLLGEKCLLEFAKNYPNFKYYLIRTSWLYGKGGRNFVDTILKLAENQKEIKVINDQCGKPTYASDLARRTRELLEGDYPLGLYHIANETENTGKGITWYDFAREIFFISRGNARIAMRKNAEIIPCFSSDFPRPAKRPKWSVLINTKIPPARNWREALKEYLRNIL